MNINITGISELKWMGMGKFKSDDHYIYYGGQEALRRNGVALTVKKSEMQYLGANLKIDKMVLVHFQGKPLNIIVIQVYDVEWFVSETKQSHSVVFAQNAPKYSIWDSFIDYDGYSTSSKRFLLTVVYIMVT